jgi:DNA-binding GntR family transcriptional regulator
VPAPSDRADTEALRLYRALKREILGAGFRPGQALAEEELAKRFGASRTPIREALIRLQADGLVRIEPRRGAFVQALTVTDFLDINELRAILEPYAARAAALRLETTQIASLRTEYAAIPVEDPDEKDSRRLEHLDAQVHAAIARASGNQRLRQLIHSLDDMMQAMRVDDMRRRHRETHESLGQLLDALDARDPDAAEVILRRHISDFRGAIVNQDR